MRRCLSMLVVYALAALGALLLLISLTPIAVWCARKLAGPWDDPRGDILVVLGGGMLGDGTLGQGSLLRAQYAVRAYREGGFRLIVITGGGSPVPVSAAMADYLLYQGVPKEAVLLETGSQSTRENALFSKRILDGLAGRKVLLTSDYHMFRAIRAFRHAGIQIEPRPVPDAIKRAQTVLGRWPAFLDVATEPAKIAWYFLRGWI